MNFKKCGALIAMLLIGTAIASPQTSRWTNPTEPANNSQDSARIEFITAEELKAQIAKSQPLAIIDVRSNYGAGEERKIAGAVRVKMRRLRSRLNFPPLK
ncbi:MAG TPA: hypothetical protein VMS31_08670, partial [Pyrinomonadaceae bacterium]|nr:hypothetical protein [Pyrinomonadaceae bacterium]